MPMFESFDYCWDDYEEIIKYEHENEIEIEDWFTRYINKYDKIISRFELYKLLEEGLDDERNGRMMPFDEFINALRNNFQLENSCSKHPNEVTLQSIAEGEKILKSGNSRFQSLDEMFNQLND